jgi:hypothetical protein
MKNDTVLNPAVYLPQIIEEYKGNPFIEALPPIMSPMQAADALTMAPGYNPSEREFDAYYRFHCVQRLFRYFQPLDTHIDIEQRISRSIRQGYIGRNPAESLYAQHSRQCDPAVRSKDFKGLPSTASGFTVIGMSGVGKTTAVERILSLYPQCITHTKYDGHPMYVKQLVWLKLDCPFDGSIKGLCSNFFNEADKILKSDYSAKFTATRTTVDSMLPKMTQIANTHGIGLLVIDEIQHLSQAKSGGSEKMLNFFVTLVNTIGIPVVLIGTTKAMPLLQSEFRQARRGSGQGDLFWDRMPKGVSWDIMLQSMWNYQWTKMPCPLSAELNDILYEESQGIIDIAIKLYAMAQIKAIADGVETIKPKLIRKVANERLKLVKPMLDALKSGDMKKIMRFEDIRPVSIEEYLSIQSVKIASRTDEPPPTTLEEQTVLKLLEMDIPAHTARKCAKKALAGQKTGQTLGHVVQKAFKLALNMDAQNAADTNVSADDADDMRNRSGDNTYDGLKSAGTVIADADEW